MGKNMTFSFPVVRVEVSWNHTKMKKGFTFDPKATMFREGKVTTFALSAKKAVVTVGFPSDGGHPGAQWKENAPGRAVFRFDLKALQIDSIKLVEISLCGYSRDSGEAVFMSLPNLEASIVDDATNVKIYSHTFRENKQHPIQSVKLYDDTQYRRASSKILELSGVKNAPAPEWSVKFAE